MQKFERDRLERGLVSCPCKTMSAIVQVIFDSGTVPIPLATINRQPWSLLARMVDKDNATLVPPDYAFRFPERSKTIFTEFVLPFYDGRFDLASSPSDALLNLLYDEVDFWQVLPLLPSKLLLPDEIKENYDAIHETAAALVSSISTCLRQSARLGRYSPNRSQTFYGHVQSNICCEEQARLLRWVLSSMSLEKGQRAIERGAYLELQFHDDILPLFPFLGDSGDTSLDTLVEDGRLSFANLYMLFGEQCARAGSKEDLFCLVDKLQRIYEKSRMAAEHPAVQWLVRKQLFRLGHVVEQYQFAPMHKPDAESACLCSWLVGVDKILLAHAFPPDDLVDEDDSDEDDQGEGLIDCVRITVRPASPAYYA
jgi:hypothetical protein